MRIGIDVDGVLADFTSAFEALVQQKHDPAAGPLAEPEQPGSDRLTTREMKRVWRTIIRTPNWWAKLPPYEPDQIARLYTLARRRKWEVFFLTKRPQTAGEPVQFQTQWWLEQHGFHLPAVLTVPGSRGELGSALRLDMVIDDQILNCIEVISSSAAKALLVHREGQEDTATENASRRGIGVVFTLEQALDVAERVHDVLKEDRGGLSRLADWFPRLKRREETLPLDPHKRTIPPLE